MSNSTRRNFLKATPCNLVGSYGIASTLLNLQMANNAVASTPGSSKALVCLFLAGGNDSFNMLVPKSAGEYNSYAASRSNLALSSSSLLNLNRLDDPNTASNNGRNFGLHPSMNNIAKLFNGGDLAFVSNVGTLVEPTTMAQYSSDSIVKPLYLFSHSDQQMHWQTSIPQERGSTGWFGRLADKVHTLNTGSASMNISLGGNNLLQIGRDQTFYTINSDGAVALRDDNDPSQYLQLRNMAIKDAMSEQYSHLLQEAFAKETSNALDAYEIFSDAFNGASISTVFPKTDTGKRLEAIAKSIAAGPALGLNRQTFFLNVGG